MGVTVQRNKGEGFIGQQFAQCGRSTPALVAWVLSAYVCSAPATASSAITQLHPLSGLTRDEFSATVRILRLAGHTDPDARFPMINLSEPAKSEVLKWHPGLAVDRRAKAVVKVGRDTFEAEVNLTQKIVERWQKMDGVQTGISSEEWSAAQKLTKSSAVWQDRMRQRGYTSFEMVFCEAYSAGYFGEQNETRRLVKVPCFDMSPHSNNLYARPIEGIFAVVDLTTLAVAEVVDTGASPLATPIDVPAVDVAAVVAQSKRSSAPSVELTGDQVRWNGWTFNIRFDRRLGAVLSLISIKDGERERSVAYQASVSEMFVPYMDADIGWSYRTFMDVGEFGFGSLASLLVEGLDCPAGSTFIDPVLPTELGAPYQAARRVCLFERKLDHPQWRHSEGLNQTFVGQIARELVVRFIPTVGNYDYIIDYVFDQNGAFRIEVGATGYPAVKGVRIENMASPDAERQTAAGTLVDQHLLAVHHDHFLSFRVDLDVDGINNSFRRERVVLRNLPSEGARRSLWQPEAVPFEKEAGIAPGHHPEVWRVINPNFTSALGHHPGYEILAGHSAVSLLSENDWPQKRAAFSARPLWVTKRKPNELHAAGDYPNQSRGGDGLPAFVDGESIGNNDLVVWYTMGFHHVTRPEDWPIQSTVRHSVTFRPFSFFTKNPSVPVTR